MHRWRGALSFFCRCSPGEYCKEESVAKYSIEIPLDASAIEDFKPEAPVKVV